jgi:hypothetical protein
VLPCLDTRFEYDLFEERPQGSAEKQIANIVKNLSHTICFGMLASNKDLAGLLGSAMLSHFKCFRTTFKIPVFVVSYESRSYLPPRLIGPEKT